MVVCKHCRVPVFQTSINNEPVWMHVQGQCDTYQGPTTYRLCASTTEAEPMEVIG